MLPCLHIFGMKFARVWYTLLTDFPLQLIRTKFPIPTSSENNPNTPLYAFLVAYASLTPIPITLTNSKIEHFLAFFLVMRPPKKVIVAYILLPIDCTFLDMCNLMKIIFHSKLKPLLEPLPLLAENSTTPLNYTTSSPAFFSPLNNSAQNPSPTYGPNIPSITYGPTSQSPNTSQISHLAETPQQPTSYNLNPTLNNQQPIPNPNLSTATDRTSTIHIHTQEQPLSAAPDIIQPTPTASNHPMATRTCDNTRRPRTFPDHVALTVTLETEPSTILQANSKPEWHAAMALEINALALNNTWTLVPPCPSQQVVGCKWVYKIKRRADGSIKRYKACLVAKGYNQIKGIDYFDTFNLMVRPTTIRLVLSIAVSSHWPIRQLDVRNAFLNGDLTEQVLMCQPPGFVDPDHPNHVCLLSKAIYDLKQSSCA